MTARTNHASAVFPMEVTLCHASDIDLGGT
jgi:hypothetical protein